MDGKTYKLTLEEALAGLFKAIAEALSEIKNAMDALTEKEKAENEYNVITSKEVAHIGGLRESIQSAIIEGSLCWTDIDKAGEYILPDFDKIVEDLYKTIKRKIETDGYTQIKQKLETTEITQSGLPKRIETAVYEAVCANPLCGTDHNGGYSETTNYQDVGEITANLCVVIADYVREVIVEIVGKRQDWHTSNGGSIMLEGKAEVEKMASEAARREAAQAWCTAETETVLMDPVLAEAFADIIDDIWNKPWLGNATTQQLLEELKTRTVIQSIKDLGYNPTR